MEKTLTETIKAEQAGSQASFVKLAQKLFFYWFFTSFVLLVAGYLIAT